MNERYSVKYITNDDVAVIGVSGGPDSLCLLHLARQIPNLKIIVAHFNHLLRPEAHLEAEFVRGVAEQLDLPYESESGDVRRYSEEHKLSLEEAARILRYRFMFATARAQHASAVVVGHTADDQVETILMHFLRGAGLAGLKGMSGWTILPEFDQQIPLVRPILHLWRHETEAYCHDHDLQPIHDPSNSDETYFRNRLRHSLIPELEKYNPGFKNTLLHTSESLAGDYEALKDAVDSTWPKVILEAPGDFISMRASTMEGIPRGLARNIFRRAMESLRPNMRNLDFDTLERAADFVDVKPVSTHSGLVARQVDLAAGLYLYREGDVVYLAALEADLPSAHWPQIERDFDFMIGTKVKLNQDFTLSASAVDVETARPFASENGDSFVAWLDADLTGDRFTVRTRRAGDAFSPLGMNRQTIKLREFFINIKLPKRARARWPLICSGDEIAWVPGFRLAHPFRITENTKRVVKFTLHAG